MITIYTSYTSDRGFNEFNILTSTEYKHIERDRRGSGIDDTSDEGPIAIIKSVGKIRITRIEKYGMYSITLSKGYLKKKRFRRGWF